MFYAGADKQDRTAGLRFTRASLYQLSYVGFYNFFKLPENSKVTCQSQLLMRAFILLLSLLPFLISCSQEPEKNEETPAQENIVANSPAEKGCLGCHSKKLDPAHDFPCVTCHQGNNESNAKALAHQGLIAEPAHPDNMEQSCGKCHAKQVADNSHSLHFTLKNKVNLLRHAFGASEPLNSMVDIPVAASPDNLLELADDLLRRRCLRCHVYYTGDRYPGVVHGSGCASCHLSFYEGKLTSHAFLKKPGDKQCLQCHYGNHVGADYYGRFEHDMNDEYRTPYTTTNDYFRPFGMEYHQLEADIHQQKGLVCVDCHNGSQLMGQTSETISCGSCHNKTSLEKKLPENISIDSHGTYTLLSANNNQKHIVPVMQHPAHQKYKQIASCQVCHARWSFNDQQTSLLRSDLDEYDDFSNLTVQGSFEVESLLLNNLDYDSEEIEPEMSDKISGEKRQGIWHKGYGIRRWEKIVVGRDQQGILQVMRPILDIYISWIDEDEEVRFDSVAAETDNGGMLPYTPHTTGKAGLFYEERIEQFLRSEKDTHK